MSYHNARTVLVVSNEETKPPVNPIGRQLAELISELGERGFLVLVSKTYHDAFLEFHANQTITSVIIDWDIEETPEDKAQAATNIPVHVHHARKLQELHRDPRPRGRSRSRSRTRSRSKSSERRVSITHEGILMKPKSESDVPRTSDQVPRIQINDAKMMQEEATAVHELTKEQLVEMIEIANKRLPIFLLTVRFATRSIHPKIQRMIDEFIWKLEDTPRFVAGRISRASADYMDKMVPPFFKGLMEYANESKYSWHTPGHMGGVAFLKSPPGSVFFNFVGENILRADLSVSVPEMGSLMEHTGLVGEAEALAAKTFGSDRTYFVTNGTSTGNKIIYMARVTSGDKVLLDRNCHKSLMHGTVMTAAVPTYLKPLRNARGIIGPVPLSEFEKIKNDENLRLAVLTNSTYDGICYHAPTVVSHVSNFAKAMMFDEAWFCHAKFHPLYKERYAMCVLEPHLQESHKIPVYSSQSTHKLLAALSQASMVHVADKKHDHELFNESFMMHTSTSPQYSIIASLDVATAMMASSGLQLIDSTVTEAIIFRKSLVDMANDVDPSRKWWFGVWQPEELHNVLLKKWHEIAEEPEEHLLKLKDPQFWVLKPGAAWHGFPDLTDNYAMLDPLKVTILTPGISESGVMENMGIPAGIVSKYLRNQRIVVEKTDFYSFLIIFSIAVTKGKSSTLITSLLEFKNDFDNAERLTDVFPDIAHIQKFKNVTLPEFAAQMHQFFVDKNLVQVLHNVYESLPPYVMIPAEAHKKQVHGEAILVKLSELVDRVCAVMVVPYPPGIPVVMPGERFTRKVVDFLLMEEEFDRLFPGFETEIHGVARNENGEYAIYCVEE
eukprot:Phypoly_transcript_02608.p1 GENE.Phypoly_transcript_02608~~Phypoly_transcript_02608.p1  ORF type:complete len:838 (+),score=132.64 Phypoly_transcript_02608:48-2561(+)